MAKNYQNFALAILSGLLLALAYPSFDFKLGLLAWFGLIPLLWALSKSRSEGGSFRLGFVSGSVYFSIVFRWFWSFYPLEAIGIGSKSVSILILLVIYSVSVVVMAICWAIFGFLSTKLKNHRPNILSLFLVPGLFTLIEYLRAFVFGILWSGSGTVYGPHWTMGNVAYSLVNYPAVLPLVSFIGIYGLVFLIVLINSLFLKTILKKNRLIWGTVVLLIIIIQFSAKSVVTTDEDRKKIDFALIQTNRPTELSDDAGQKLANFKEQLGLLNGVARKHPESQLIVFPEATDFFTDLSTFLSTAQVEQYFNKLFQEPRLIISGSRILAPDGRAYSRIFALNTKGDIIKNFDKHILTPLGESLPYSLKFIGQFTIGGKLTDFDRSRSLSAGPVIDRNINFRDKFSAGPLVCSELLSPDFARKMTAKSGIIVGMTSTAIFHGSQATVREILAIAQMRAAENQKPLIMAANRGLSYAIDSRGNIQSITPDQDAQVLTGNLVLSDKISWYNKLGDWPILLVSGLSLAVTISPRKKHVLTT